MQGLVKKVLLNLNYLPVLNPDIVTAVSLMTLFRFVRIRIWVYYNAFITYNILYTLCYIICTAKIKADE